MGLAQLRPLVFVMDASEVGRACLALVTLAPARSAGVSIVYSQCALPIAWVVMRGSKGHFSADAHVLCWLHLVSGRIWSVSWALTTLRVHRNLQPSEAQTVMGTNYTMRWAIRSGSAV